MLKCELKLKCLSKYFSETKINILPLSEYVSLLSNLLSTAARNKRSFCYYDSTLTGLNWFIILCKLRHLYSNWCYFQYMKYTGKYYNNYGKEIIVFIFTLHLGILSLLAFSSASSTKKLKSQSADHFLTTEKWLSFSEKNARY